MMMKLNNRNKKKFPGGFFIVCLLCLVSPGCKKFLDIPLPVDEISGSAAYSTDRSISAVITNIYGSFVPTLPAQSIFDGAGNGVGYTTGLYGDELQLLPPAVNANASARDRDLYINAALGADTGMPWIKLYELLYQTNLAIEGIKSAKSVLQYKDQWLGEVLFLRAFMHFYLVNLYGDVILANSTGFKDLANASRVPKAEVYKLVITDLLEAQRLLTPDYKDASGKITLLRCRANKSAATALLARVYLYTGDWANAEAQATSIIPLFSLPAPADVFLKASQETILSLQPFDFVKDYTAYYNLMPDALPATSSFSSYVTVSLNPALATGFETNDLRKTAWVRTVTRAAGPLAAAETRYFSKKYKTSIVNTEYIVMFRAAEQWLIRAEARAQQDNLTGAKEDLNRIRTRAGLGSSPAVSKAELLTAILKERRAELFLEVGHRFFDLRRTGTLDAAMNVVAPQKGSVWNTQKQYWPIPDQDLIYGPNLTQTPGY
jgi:hypothetical protein